MYTEGKPTCEFDGFQFDADRLVLFHQNVLVKRADKKTLEVLAALLLHPNYITSHEEIISSVWPGNIYGVTSARINQYISRLQKLLREYEPQNTYIENVRGRGYRFCANVRTLSHDVNDAAGKRFHSALVSRRSLSYTIIFIVASSLLGFSAWTWGSTSDEELLKNLVKESQFFESLVLYKDPKSFNEEDLDRFWLRDVDANGSYDRRTIRNAVRKLVEDGRYYGDETKPERFEFQSVEISAASDEAVVRTFEKWFVAEYQNDGTLIKNKNVGPYFVSYLVRKVDGLWRVERSTTARMARPMPQITGLDADPDRVGGRQFVINFSGHAFEPENVLVEVVGPGCPKIKPCSVANQILRENSDLTATSLRNVPLTLATGDYIVTLRNGDSPASVQMPLIVP